jgi:RNA polymerase sigma-70 factor (ECF subfamily)
VTFDNIQSQAEQTNAATEFENLFQENWARVYGVIFRIVGDPDEAEDLALEAFLKLYNKLNSKSSLKILSSGSSFGGTLNGWLYRVASNLGLNALRARKRREQYELAAGRITLENSSSENPSQTVERSEERQRVRQILSQMKPKSAKILVLRHSGLSYTEIAQAVRISPNSVGKLLSRAEKEFERRYQALEGS